MKAQTQALVTGDRFNFGRYSEPFSAINPLDAEPFAPKRVPQTIKNFRLKEWQAFQFATPRYFGMVALFNAKVLALVQVKLYDRHTQKKYLFERKVTPWSLHAPSNLLDSRMAYRGKGCRIQFENKLAEDRVMISFDLDESADCPALQGQIQGLAQGQTPLVVAIPFGENHGMYSHKGLLPAQGHLVVGGERTDIASGEGYVLIDDHRGYYPWVMKWDWVTSGKYTEDGKLFGFNLTRNDSIDPENYNENGFWLDGRLYALPPVTFTRLPLHGDEIWEIRDQHGKVHVDFKVAVPGKVDINALIVRSKYRGPFGYFSGYVEAEDGTRMAVDDMFGMGEDFYLRC